MLLLLPGHSYLRLHRTSRRHLRHGRLEPAESSLRFRLRLFGRMLIFAAQMRAVTSLPLRITNT
jgi:hypothetical protein